MATLYVTEYTRLANDYSGQSVPIGLEPSVTSIVTIGGASATTPIKSSTKFVRLHTDAICNVRFNGAATTSDVRLAANQTEYLGIGPGITAIAVIAGV